MAFEIAQRKALPVLVSFTGRSGSGKTYSALLFARGLVGPEGKIFVIDTERGRASIYADDPAVGGFYTDELHPPFTAQAFINKIQEAERAGADVIIIDSASHEWSGLGGAIDQANERDPHGRLGPTAWTKPKLAHKKLVNTLIQCTCHVICNLRGEYRMVAFKDEKGKQQFGETDDLVPEQEKRFIYEMTLSATIDLETHKARFTKLPLSLCGVIADKVIDVESGKVVRDWIMSGVSVDADLERLKNIARDRARHGEADLRAFWGELSRDEQVKLKPSLEHFKEIAKAADEVSFDDDTGFDESPPKQIDNPLDDDVENTQNEDVNVWRVQSGLPFEEEFSRLLEDAVATKEDVRALVDANADRLTDELAEAAEARMGRLTDAA